MATCLPEFNALGRAWRKTAAGGINMINATGGTFRVNGIYDEPDSPTVVKKTCLLVFFQGRHD
jgi:hypothetical protein